MTIKAQEGATQRTRKYGQPAWVDRSQAALLFAAWPCPAARRPDPTSNKKDQANYGKQIPVNPQGSNRTESGLNPTGRQEV
jgi:hypothetical protein